MMSVFLSDGGATTSTTISVTTGALTSLGIGLGANASNTLSAIANPIGLFATGTLTSDATNVSVDDTVTVGGKTYTFKAVPGATENAVDIGADAAESLVHLAAAVNLTGDPGDYGTATTINANVTAGTPTATTLVFTAKADGVLGNAIAFAEGSTHLSVGAANLAGGAQAQVVVGANTYKFVAALTASTTAGEVLRGATAAATLANLAAAVNLGAGAGVAYGSETLANATVTAGTPTASTITFTAKVAGTGGNTIATTFTNGTNMGWSSGTTMDGGSGSAGLTTADAGKAALTAITAAVSTVAGLRGTIGAGVNQLHAASAVIGNQIQNLTAGEDGIRGANIPEEIANMARFNILTQTGIAALSQANSQQQAILALLR
jgi:flagellin